MLLEDPLLAWHLLCWAIGNITRAKHGCGVDKTGLGRQSVPAVAEQKLHTAGSEATSHKIPIK